MNPIYKIVKGILDLFRQVKKSKINIPFQKYDRRIDWENIRILPIVMSVIGISVTFIIGWTVLKAVSQSASLQTNTTGINISELGNGANSSLFGIFFVLILIPVIYGVIKIFKD